MTFGFGPSLFGSDSVSFGQTLALRWHGHAWTLGKTVSPGDGDRFLQAVTAPTAQYALAVGNYLKGNQTRALAERWTGSGWSIVPAATRLPTTTRCRPLPRRELGTHGRSAAAGPA